MRLDRYIKQALWLSAGYAGVTFWLGNYIILLCITILIIAFNFSVSLTHLLTRGKITSGIIILNVFQLLLFCQLHIQIHDILGATHYSYTLSPSWYDWAELVAVHALRAVDLLDAIEAYGINLQNIRNQSTLSGLALFSMHIMVDIFILGAIFNAISRGSSKNRLGNTLLDLGEEFIDSLIPPRDYRHWGVLATTIMMCFAGYFADCLQSGIPLNWFLYPLDSILRTIDFGDAFQIFDWRLHSLEMGPGLATLAVYFRLLIASYTIMIANRLYLRFLEGHGKSVEDLAMICISSEYSKEERIIALRALEKFGPYPPHLISCLVESLSEWEKRYTSATILREIGTPAISHIVKLLTHREEAVRRDITGLLEEIDPWWHRSEEAHKAIPHLVRALATPDTDAHFAALEALGEIDPQWPRSQGARSAVPHFIKALENRNINIRITAVSALEAMGPGAEKAIFQLVRLLADHNSIVREVAVDALEKIDAQWELSEDAHRAAPYLVKSSASSEKSARKTIRKALDKIYNL